MGYEIEEIPFTIPRDNFEMQQLFSTMLDSPGKKEINFANPEFLQTAMKNPQLKKHLENANYNFCDGIGLLMLINKEIGTSYGVESRYPGTDFFNYLPQNREIRIFLYVFLFNPIRSASNITSIGKIPRDAWYDMHAIMAPIALAITYIRVDAFR